MRLLDRYLLVEWLKALGLALGATLAVLLLEDMYSNLSDLLADGAHGTHVLTYYWTLLPGFLPAVMPMSQLVSLLFVAGNLHRNHEITAMRAAGLSLWRIARPWWVGGAVLAALLGWLDATVVPASIEQARQFREQLHRDMERRTKPATKVGLVGQLTYENAPAHRRWFINQYSTDTQRATGVSIYQLDDQGNDQSYLLASEGYYDTAKGHWVLLKGEEIKFDKEGKAYADIPFEHDKEEFVELKEDPALMLTLRQKPDDLSMDEISGALAQSSSTHNGSLDSFAVQYYAFLIKPLICLLVVGLAIPLAVAGVRTSPMVGASKAVGLFFAYYVVQGTCTHLGNQHYLPAMIAAGLPIALMLGLSVWLFKREA